MKQNTAFSHTKTNAKQHSQSKSKNIQTVRTQNEIGPKKSSDIQKVVIHKSTRGRAEQKEWTYEQERKLFELHDQMGNRWTNISKHFQERTDNDIKNHLFSRFRLSIRRINKIISHTPPPNKLKLLKASIILKIISTCEMRLKGQNKISSRVLNLSLKLKKDLLSFLYQHESDRLSEKVQILIRELHQFNQMVNNSKRKQSLDTQQVNTGNFNHQHVDNSAAKQECAQDAASMIEQQLQQNRQKDYFNQLINEPNTTTGNRPYFQESQHDQQPLPNQSQLIRSPILLGDGPFSLQQLPEVLPPFFLDEAYQYGQTQNYLRHHFQTINSYI